MFWRPMESANVAFCRYYRELLCLQVNTGGGSKSNVNRRRATTVGPTTSMM